MKVDLHALKLLLLFLAIGSIECLSPGGTWKQVGTILSGDVSGYNNDHYYRHSSAVSADGETIVFGVPSTNINGNHSGQVRVYMIDTISNTLMQIGSDINGGAAHDHFGHVVAVSADGTTIAIGAPYYERGINLPGHVYVYSINTTSNSWIKIGDDLIMNGDFGYYQPKYSIAMSADGRTIATAIGLSGYETTTSFFQVCIYSWSTALNNWMQIGLYVNSDHSLDKIGHSIAMSADGTTIAIGASDKKNSNNIYSGIVRVYTTFSSPSKNWTQLGYDIDGESVYDSFGDEVAMVADGKTIVVGVPFSDHVYPTYSAHGKRSTFGIPFRVNNTNSGHVCVYSFNTTSNSWVKIGGDINGDVAYDQFGSGVAISANGTTLAIGAPFHDNPNTTESGHVQVFTFNMTSDRWVQFGSDIIGELSYDHFGLYVSMSADGKIIAIGGLSGVYLYKYEISSTKSPLKPPTTPTKTPTKSPTTPTKTLTKSPSTHPITLHTTSPLQSPTTPTKTPTRSPPSHAISPSQSPIKTVTTTKSPSRWPHMSPSLPPAMNPIKVPMNVATKCGFFGWNFFCPHHGKCGFWKQLFNFNRC